MYTHGNAIKIKGIKKSSNESNRNQENQIEIKRIMHWHVLFLEKGDFFIHILSMALVNVERNDMPDLDIFIVQLRSIPHQKFKKKTPVGLKLL